MSEATIYEPRPSASSRSEAAPQIGSARFQNALARRPQLTPPVWLMRQAGRYHHHYQALRARHSFMDLCKQPELAAEVAFGPVVDFGFDAAILFSDLLFPLEALGMGLAYTDHGPQLDWKLDAGSISQLRSIEDAWPHLLFQGEAMRATRERIPANRSLIGFVGGPWTLFVYAVEGTHKGSLTNAKRLLPLFPAFCETMVPLLERNIQLQLDHGAEIVMIFDTAAGELSPKLFQTEVVPRLTRLTSAHKSRIGYYSKGTQPAHLRDPLFTGDHLAGIGVDHGWDIREAFAAAPRGFVQGNFDQALLHSARAELKAHLLAYFTPMKEGDWPGWICGLGHGVLPATPEDNVRMFVDTVREIFRE
ncbi:MAG TPA: uroporphyrinogen decarboxylase family protein [Pyrinomonadaceae bacterium]|nr:uroporphyrinogen decarboxylase family protein [Pyrinomonadaceae bacterium]